MVLPTIEEIKELERTPLQKAAEVVEKELGVEINRGAKTKEIRAETIKFLTEHQEAEAAESEPESAPVDEEVIEEPDVETQPEEPPVEEPPVEEPPVEEPPVEEPPVEEAPPEETSDPVPEPKFEPKTPDILKPEQLPDEEITEDTKGALYACRSRFKDWESGWTFDPLMDKPKPIEIITPALQNAINEGRVVKIEE